MTPMVVILLLLAVTWSGIVVLTVIGSAPSGGESLIALGREVATPGSPEGVWILCAMAASAGLALAWAIAAWRRRRHGKQLSIEFDQRWAERTHVAAQEEARGRLLESRERELQTTIDTLTAQRDALVDEMAALRQQGPPGVVRLHDAEDEKAAERR
jgi:hypothetical protein